MLKIKLFRFLSGLALCCTALAAAAAGPSAVYVFGDSLSDTGNVAEKVYKTNFLNPPSYHDSFTNGKVAAEVLAETYGLKADPSLWANRFRDQHRLFGRGFKPGTNYAVGGATATDRGVAFLKLDLPEQVNAFITHVAGTGSVPADALYAVIIGGNDVRTAAQALNTSFITSGVASELAQLQLLISRGAKNLLVVGVPDVSVIPEFTTGPADEAAAARADSLLYNSNLQAGIANLRVANPLVKITYFDLLAFNANLLASAATYGFANTTEPCYTSDVLTTPVTTSPGCGPVTPSGAANIDQFIYFDVIHPTARVHALWAQGMAAALASFAGLTPTSPD